MWESLCEEDQTHVLFSLFLREDMPIASIIVLAELEISQRVLKESGVAGRGQCIYSGNDGAHPRRLTQNNTEGWSWSFRFIRQD